MRSADVYVEPHEFSRVANIGVEVHSWNSDAVPKASSSDDTATFAGAAM